MSIKTALYTLCIILFVALCGAARTGSQQQQECLPLRNLPSTIAQIAYSPIFTHQSWAMLIQRRNATTGIFETIFEWNALQYMQPASNNKVLTTAAAFNELGADFKWRTPFVADMTGAVSPGAIPRLCVIGQGDPSMTLASLNSAVNSIKSQGFNSIQQLIIDDTIFPDPPGTWEIGDFLYYYGAKPSSFILEENVIEFEITPAAQVGGTPSVKFNSPVAAACVQIDNQATTIASNMNSTISSGVAFGSSKFTISGGIPLGSGPHHNRRALIDPNAYFKCALSYYMNSNGISVGSIARGVCPKAEWADKKIVAKIESPPISTTMNWTMMVSDNLYSECYLRTLGARSSAPLPAGGNAQTAGLRRVREILSSMGVDTEQFQQVDGSGLSRYNLVSPVAMVSTLKAVAATKDGALYKTFLPVAGVSGSLQHRFIGTPAVGIVHAKTGTLSGVVTLSGWIDKGSGYVFSVMSNQSNQPASVVQKEGVDKVVLQVVNLCEY